MSDANERYKKAAAFSPQGAERDLLARLLMGTKPTAPPNLPFTGLTNTPGLPPFEQPGSEMKRFQPPIQPQQAPPPPMAPQTMPAPPPMAAAPPMPDPTAVAPAPQVPTGMNPAAPDVRAVIAEMQRRAFQNAPAPWTLNQGSLRDQTG